MLASPSPEQHQPHPVGSTGADDRHALQLAGDNLHDGIAGLVTVSGSKGSLMGNDGFKWFVHAQDLPAGRFAVADSAADLPDPHDRIVVFREPNIVNLDHSGIAVITKL